MESQQQLEFQRLCQLSKLQSSDLVFLHDETRFLKSLLFRFFMPMMEACYINRVQLINGHLSELALLKANLVHNLLLHQEHLQTNSQSALIQKMDFLKLENERIKEELNDLNRSLNDIKKEIFSIYKDLALQEPAKKTCQYL
jgi:hypothetical protein